LLLSLSPGSLLGLAALTLLAGALLLCDKSGVLLRHDIADRVRDRRA
jgi:hypothetical protein